ncbi:hypothetical protein EAF04_006976 [Stromatinia cepivora]|nr:hypothetical protein EAF04_006976 [Stromatinia cepivora]
MTNLYGILNQLRLVVSRFDDESITSTTQFQHTGTCRTLLDRIKERLDKADSSHIGNQKPAISRKVSTLGRALAWPFSVSETKALIDDMTTQKSTLMLGLQVDGMNLLLNALGDRKTQGLKIEAIRANVLALRNEESMSILNKKQKEIIEWIAPYDPSQRHQEIATKLRQPGTGQWFTKGDHFKHWFETKASKLWLYGIPGAGKTILTSSAISCLFDQLGDGDYECGHSRSNTVRLLTGLNATKDSNIKIILTSRPEPDIERHLEDFEKLSIAAHRNDLELYVHSELECRVREERLFIRDQNLREEIIRRLVDEAQGMFRWVTCQLDSLGDLDSPKAIRQALHSLPPTLFGTYERILDRINLSSDVTKALVHRVLTWTVCSVEPLSLAQLLEAVSVDLSDNKLDRDGIPDEKSILKRCSSLVRKTGGPLNTRIELAHFSVKEFLLLKVQDDPYASYRISQDHHNAYTAKVCLTYLLFEDFRDIISYTTQGEKAAMDEKYAFYKYAARYLVHHACGNSDDEDILKLIKLLFDPIKTNNFVSWAQELLFALYQSANSRKIIASASTLHFAILFSLHRVVEWLISDTNTRSHLNKDTDIGTLLACAVAPERVLGGVEHDWGGSPRTNPLELAIKARFGWEILLQHGALVTDSCIKALGVDLNLHLDFVTSFVQEIQLKNVPVHINARRVDLATPASKDGHLEIVKILLNHGASLDLPTSKDAKDTEDGLFDLECATSFHLAVVSGHLDVASILEESGAGINGPDKSGLTPLHSATGQRINMIEYLIQSSRQRHSFSTATPSGWTVLMKAADLGTFDVFKYVLQNSSPSVLLLQSETGFNCLHLAVLSKVDSRQKVAMLRQSCIDPCIPTIEGFLPLHLAAERGFYTFRETLNFTLGAHSLNYRGTSTVRAITNHALLQSSDARWSILDNLRHDENMLNCLTGSGQSILHIAINNLNFPPFIIIRMLRLLLASSQSLSLDVQDENGKSALLVLCNMLLQKSTLNAAPGWRSFFASAIGLLLRDGATATQQDNQGNTALHYLCKSEQFTILDDIYINLTAGFGTTPLFFAIYGKRHDIMELLLSYGATTSELYGPRKLTPLHLAVAGGNELVVKTLLQYGADAQARDSAGCTPAMIALDLEYESIAKILNDTLA